MTSYANITGVVEFATGTARATTVLAVRDTELGKLPEGLLNTIKLKHPKVHTTTIYCFLIL